MEKKPIVVFFMRKQRPSGNFSVEKYFCHLSFLLQDRFDTRVVNVPFYSDGFVKRLLNACYCVFRQGDINHVTGDINYVVIFLRKRKTVLTVLDLGFLRKKGRLKKYLLKLFWLDLPLKRIRCCISISESTKKEIQMWSPTCRTEMRVIYIGIKESLIGGKESCKKDRERFTILQIGTSPNKNLARLILALRGLDVELVVLGVIDSNIKKLILETNLKVKNISTPLSDEEVCCLYINSDLVSFISTVEGFGMPIIEGQSFGIPVITSNVSSMPEIGGDGAFYVNPYSVDEIRSGVLKLINDDLLRKKLILNGYVNKERFDYVDIANKHSEVYINLLSDHIRN